MEKLLKFLSAEEWKGLQSYFSAVTGITSVTFNLEGENLFSPDFRNEFCQIVKSKALGQIACKESHKTVAQVALANQKPAIGRCHAGFIKVVVPINFNGEIIGVTGGCGVLFQEDCPDEVKIKSLAIILGQDYEEMMEKSRTVCKITQEILDMEVLMISKLLREKENLYTRNIRTS